MSAAPQCSAVEVTIFVVMLLSVAALVLCQPPEASSSAFHDEKGKTKHVVEKARTLLACRSSGDCHVCGADPRCAVGVGALCPFA